MKHKLNFLTFSKRCLTVCALNFGHSQSLCSPSLKTHSMAFDFEVGLLVFATNELIFGFALSFPNDDFFAS